MRPPVLPLFQVDQTTQKQLAMNHFYTTNLSLRRRFERLHDRLILLAFLLMQTFASEAQTVTHNWTANCGTPIAFQDPGGAGNYSANQHHVYTVCPGTPNRFATVTFTMLDLGFYDHITVINGSSSQNPFLTTLKKENNFASGSLTFTSSAADGCLSLIFSSDNANHGAGWNATYNCLITPGTNVNICQETDCVGGCARTVCGSGVYTWQNAFDNMEDLNTLNAGCLTAHHPELERNHVWYYINPQTAGTLEVIITSDAGGQIYDFALWKSVGESITCPAFSGDSPMLCESEDNGQNNTTPQGSGFSDDVWVDVNNPSNLPYHAYPGFEPPVVITAQDIADGAVYMLLINVRSNGTPQPVVTISMDGILDCTPLAIDLVEFFGTQVGTSNFLSWETTSEVNNSHFILERSTDNENWELLSLVNGAGTTTEPNSYYIEDRYPNYPLNYYRLKQVDFDGDVTQYKTISLTGNPKIDDWIGGVFPNPASNQLRVIHNSPDLENSLLIELMDNCGKKVHSQEQSISHMNQEFTLSIDKLNSGIYTLIFRQGDNSMIQRVVLLND